MIQFHNKHLTKAFVLIGILFFMSIRPVYSGEDAGNVGKSEKEILKTYLKSAADTRFTSPNDRKKFAVLALELAVKAKDKSSEYEARVLLGLAFVNIGDINNAKEVFDKILEEVSEDDYPNFVATSYNQTGEIFRFKGDFINALENHYKALDIASKNKDYYEKAFSLNAIGVVLRNLSDSSQAILFYNEALKVSETHKIYDQEIQSMLNIGNLHWYSKKYDLALKCYNKAIELCHKNNVRDELASLYNNIGNVYRDKAEYTTAIQYYNKSIIELDQNPERLLYGIVIKNIGQVYYLLNDLDKAESYLLKSLEYNIFNDLKRFTRDNQELLAMVYAKKGDYRKAYEHMDEYAKTNSEILNENVIQKYISLQQTFLKQKNMFSIQNEKSIKRNNILILVSVTLSIIMIFAFILLLQNRQKQYYIKELKKSIEEKSETEKALRKSEKNYFTLISHMNEGMIHTDPFDFILFANEKACKMFGFTHDEFVGKNIYELLEIPGDKVLLDEKTELRKKGISDRYEVRFKRRNGKMLWASLSVAPVLDENGVLNGTVGIINDISEQKRHEEELKELTSDLNQKIKQLNCLYDISDITGIPGITYSEIFTKALDILPIGLKYSHDACVEILFENQRFYSKDYKETKWSYSAPIKVTNKKLGVLKVCYLSEKPIVSKDVFHFNEKILIKNIAEKLGQIIESKNMECALKESREKLAEAHRIARLGNWEYDYCKQMFNYFENFFEVIGVNQRDRLIFDQEALFNHIHPDDSTLFADFMEQIKSCKAPNTNFMFRVNDHQGSLKYINTIGSIEYDATGKPIRYISTIQDVTDYKLNEELRHNMQLAQKTAEIKQQFLANMSHEMRTPMNGILGMIDFLLKTPLDEKQMDFALTIKHSSENLLNIINDILDLSKIEAGKLEIKPKNFNILSFIEKIKGLFGALAKQKNLKFISDTQEGIPEYIIADENRVAQIVTNLIGNAIKFTEKGSVKLHITYFNRTEENVQIRIDVIDTGIGISKEDQQRLFQPFTQLDNSITRPQEGTGLGLSISKRLAELLEGEIGFNPSYKKGANFFFTFKAHIGSKESLQIAELPVIPENSNLNLHILVVEDNHVNQRILSMMLKDMGCETTLASNGEEAIMLMKNQKFNAVFMDIQMPVMDGVTAMQILRKKYKNLPPIIALSANAMSNDIERYMKQGMDDYITKPVNPALVYEKLLKIKNTSHTGKYKNTVLMNELNEQPLSEINSHKNGLINDFNSFPQLNPKNIETLRRQTQNAPGLFSELFTSFIEDCNELIAQISDSIVSKDYKKLSEAIHTIKGLSGTIGASRMYEITSFIDKSNKSNDFTTAVDLYPTLNQCFVELREYINSDVIAS